MVTIVDVTTMITVMITCIATSAILYFFTAITVLAYLSIVVKNQY